MRKVDSKLGKTLVLHNRDMTLDSAFDLEALDVWIYEDECRTDGTIDTIYIKIPKEDQLDFFRDMVIWVAGAGADEVEIAGEYISLWYD